MKPANRKTLVLIATILGSSVVLLDGTIVNLALPSIGRHLGAGFSTLQWVIDAYVLSLSSLILLGGSLGDILGRKKVYMTGLIGFGASSLLCAIAPNAPTLIVFRVVQGIFGALLIPGALAIITTNFPVAERGQAIGRWTAWGSIATVVGPLLGGSILAITSWRWIFIINLPIITICLLLSAPAVKESRDPKGRHIDGLGALLVAMSLAALTYSFIEGPVEHWRLVPLLVFGLGIVAGLAFLWQEASSRDPMIKLSLFKSRNFSGSNLMTFGMYGALSGCLFSLVIYLQTHLGYSSLAAGFSLLPVSIVMFLFAGRVGSLSAKYGPRRFMSIGPLLMASGIGSFYFLHHGSTYLTSILPGALLFAGGLVLTVAPLTTTVMAAAGEANSGIASGINNAISRIAGLLVIAVLGLFGAAHTYHFAIALSAALAAGAGIISFLVIEKKPF